MKIGALVPLSRPGWVAAGRHRLAGLELGAQDAGLELVVRDTAADPAPRPPWTSWQPSA